MVVKKKTAKKKIAKKSGSTKELKPSDPEFLPVEYNMTEAGINQLRKEYDPVLIPDTETKGDEGYLIVHDKVMDIVKRRTGIEKKRKLLKSDALAWGKKVDGEAKRLTEIIEEIEKPWKDIKTELDEKEAVEAEKARLAEVERIQIIEAKVSQLKDSTSGLLTFDVVKLKERLTSVTAIVINESYGEFAEAAQFHKDNAVGALDAAITEREVLEEQQAKVKRDQEELAAKQKKIDDENAAKQKVLDDNIAEAKKTQLANEVEAKRLKDEAEKQVAAEKQRKEDEAFAELQEKQRKEKEQLEAEEETALKETLAARLPEDEKMRVYIANLRAVELPDVKNKDMKNLVVKVLMKLDDISDLIFNNTQG